MIVLIKGQLGQVWIGSGCVRGGKYEATFLGIL